MIERLARSQDEVERRVAAGAYWNRGQCYQLKGDAPRAEADKKDALSRDPRLAAQRSGF